MCHECVQYQIKIRKTLVVHVLQTMQHLVISRYYFAQDDKEMYHELSHELPSNFAIVYLNLVRLWLNMTATAVARVCHSSQTLFVSISCFAENSKEMYKDS